jgi:hypothetical protein
MLSINKCVCVYIGWRKSHLTLDVTQVESGTKVEACRVIRVAN